MLVWYYNRLWKSNRQPCEPHREGQQAETVAAVVAFSERFSFFHCEPFEAESLSSVVVFADFLGARSNEKVEAVVAAADLGIEGLYEPAFLHRVAGLFHGFPSAGRFKVFLGIGVAGRELPIEAFHHITVLFGQKHPLLVVDQENTYDRHRVFDGVELYLLFVGADDLIGVMGEPGTLYERRPLYKLPGRFAC